MEENEIKTSILSGGDYNMMGNRNRQITTEKMVLHLKFPTPETK